MMEYTKGLKTFDEFEWTEGNTPTIFYQGMANSQIQLAKYTGKRGFVATTDEHVFCRKGVDLIKNPFIGCEISEVTTRNTKLWNLNPLSSIQYLITGFANWKNDMVISGAQDESIAAHAISITRISVAQDTDVESHKKKYDKLDNNNGNIFCSYTHANYAVIFYGVSRGAATTFNSVCLNYYKNIKLVVSFKKIFYDLLEIYWKDAFMTLKECFGFAMADCLRRFTVSQTYFISIIFHIFLPNCYAAQQFQLFARQTGDTIS